jgi:hypothetical protein
MSMHSFADVTVYSHQPVVEDTSVPTGRLCDLDSTTSQMDALGQYPRLPSRLYILQLSIYPL